MSRSAAEPRHPKVSVCLITYNHERYIGQAVESVLEQRAAFDYELVVGDDGSTDRTRRLLEALRDRYPRALTLLSSSARLGGPGNLARTLAACQGQYVALLEGDDYWISPAKLQRQAEFLDGRQDCGMVFHNVEILEQSPTGDDPSTPGPASEIARIRRQLARQAAGGRDTFTLDTLLRECVVPTSSVMFRRATCPPIPDWYQTLTIGDWPLHALTAEHGHVGYVNEVLSVYRIHDRGLSWSRSPVQRGLDAIAACQYVDAHLGSRLRGVHQRLTLLHLRVALLYQGQGDGRKALLHARRAVSMAARRPTSIPGMLGAGVRWLIDRRRDRDRHPAPDA